MVEPVEITFKSTVKILNQFDSLSKKNTVDKISPQKIEPLLRKACVRFEMHKTR